MIIPKQNLSISELLKTSIFKDTIQKVLKPRIVLNLDPIMSQLREFPNDSRVTEMLTPFNLKDMQIDDVDRLRNKLLELMTQDDALLALRRENHRPLGDAIFKILLVLAKVNPINKEDPITLEEIAEINRVSISTGHQFDIVQLITAHAARLPRSDIGETTESKWIINPITNQKVNTRDSSVILQLAEKKNITIPNLKVEIDSSTLDDNESMPSHFRYS